MPAGEPPVDPRRTRALVLPNWLYSKSAVLALIAILVLDQLAGCSSENRVASESGIDEPVARAGTSATTSADMPSESELRAVPTFESLGLYWRQDDGVPGDECHVRYRVAGESTWSDGLPLWFDPRNQECRGSLVHLQPDTSYEVEIALNGEEDKETLTARTWSESVPILEEVVLPEESDSPLVITQSGSPDGYVLFTHQSGKEAVIDVKGKYDSNIIIDASYLVIRGLELRNAATHAIQIAPNSHDIVIENNDISGWGAVASDGWGVDHHSAIATSRRGDNQVSRLIIQRNRMHHPRSDSNAWDEYRAIRDTYHPEGPQAISLWNTAGNHVIRYNEIYSDDDHKFNDCIGGGENFSGAGFPNRDSDIYGNFISHCWDDGIEAEGASANVRIWGNYIDMSYIMIAVAPTHVGPIYIWRNVADRSRQSATKPMRKAKRGVFVKTQSKKVRGRYYGGGRIYVFHNTLLQRDGENQGVYSGLNELGSDMVNMVSRNNILHVNADYRNSIDDSSRSTINDFDYDLYNGKIVGRSDQEANGIRGTPSYVPHNGHGPFYLFPSSPGHDDGVSIPNFSDGYEGLAPDIGAYESDSTRLQFGVDANR